MHAGKDLQLKGKVETEALLKWCANFPAILGAWDCAKQDHYRQLVSSGFEPCVKLLNDMFFEPAEREFFVQLGDRIAAKVKLGKKPEELAIPFLDNPGPPYERGFTHGSVFREEIARTVTEYRALGRHPRPGNERSSSGCSTMSPNIAPTWPKNSAGLPTAPGNRCKTFAGSTASTPFSGFRRAARRSSCATPATRSRWARTSNVGPQRRCMLLRRVRYKDADFYAVGWYGTVWVEMALTRSGLAVGANSAPVMPKQNGKGLPQHFGLYPLLFRAATVPRAWRN